MTNQIKPNIIILRDNFGPGEDYVASDDGPIGAFTIVEY